MDVSNASYQYNKRQCPRQQNNQQQQLIFGRKFFRDKFLCGIFSVKSYLPKSSLAGKVRVGLRFRVRFRVRIELG